MANKTQTSKTADLGVLLHLKPEQIVADSNIRFGLKQSRIDSLAADIAEKGGVIVPVEVEPIKNGTYSLTSGNYRHAAVTRLNRDGAGLTIPAIIVQSAGIERLRRQLSENTERENMSPMDEAVAITQLLGEGLTRMEIREIFTRPGLKEPATNSFLNMRMSFLNFPKKIQNMIHSGEFGVKAAYFLTREPEDKWEPILARAVKETAEETAFEGKIEAEYLASVKKEEEAKVKAETATSELTKAMEVLKVTEDTYKTATEAAAAAYETQTKMPSKSTKEEKEAAAKEFRAKQAEALAAKKALETAQSDERKLKEKATKAADHAREIAEKLTKAREEKAAKPVSPAAISKAADKEGSSVNKNKGMNPTQIKEAIYLFMAPGATPKVALIGKALIRLVTNLTSARMCYRELQEAVGEKSEGFPERPNNNKKGEGKKDPPKVTPKKK